jgi:hypothetical protein
MLYIVEPSTGRTEGVDPGTHPLDVQPLQHPSARQTAGGPGEARAGQKRPDVTPREPSTQRKSPQSTEEFAGRGTAVTDATVTRQALQQSELEEYEQGQTGATRAVRVTKPNRKRSA